MKTILLFICYLFCIIPYIANAQIVFEKTYGGITADYASSVQQTTDGGYIIVGYTDSYGVGFADVYLIKTDSIGDTLWTKTYGGTGDEWGYSVQQTLDGGYIIAGNTDSYGAGFYDVYLIKTDAIGDTLWTKTYGEASDEYGWWVQQTTDGGYIVAGYTLSFGAGGEDIYLIKTDASGDTLWTKTYGGINNDRSYYIRQTTDGGYIIAGNTESFGAGSWDVYLIKTNSSGDTLWTKTYGGTGDEWGGSVQQTTDSGYIIAGYTNSYGAGVTDVYLIKTNAVGDTLWTKIYGGIMFDAGYFVQQTIDAGYIITGVTRSFGAGESYAYLIKTNSVGDTLWTKKYGGTGDESGGSVQQIIGGGYIIAGSTKTFGAGSQDIYLIKTDSNGNTGCNQASTNTIVGSTASIVNSGGIVGSGGGVVGNPATIVSSTATIDSVLCYTCDTVKAGFSYIDTGLVVNFYDSSFNATSYKWYFGDGDSSILQNPSHTYSGSGTYYVCLEATNSCNTDTYCDSVMILITGVEEKDLSNNIIINPNPFSSSTTITLNGVILSETKHLTLKVYDLLGREKDASHSFSMTSGGLVVELQRGKLPDGLYFYKIINEQNIIGKGKLIVN